ncbi:unnamed protein product [Cylindrotheca closterium]|uniref:SKP1-like protein n=1 Tax=Cylindrotheca closterium TaxID=2856 RepID=A0AAD2FQQ5_9STRA|nr:unnamed protein product [Cylindrotheca closterium]
MDSEEGTVVLVSKEGDKFPVPKAVAYMSGLAKDTIDDENDDDEPEVPLPNVKADVLRKVIEYCEHYLKEKMTDIEKPLKSNKMSDVVQEWYATFVDSEEHEMLFELILAANFMDIKPLLELASAAVAAMMKGRTPEEIRKVFKIQEGDFTPEEENRVREENKWCEEA